MKNYWNFYSPLKTFILLKVCKLEINIETLQRRDYNTTIIIDTILLKGHYISLASLLPSQSYYVISPNTKESLLNSRCTRVYIGSIVSPPNKFVTFIINNRGEILEPFRNYIINKKEINNNIIIRYHGNYYIVKIIGSTKSQYIVRYSDGKLLNLGKDNILIIMPGGDKGGNICRVIMMKGLKKYCNYFDTKTEKYLLPKDILVEPDAYLGPFSENSATWFDSTGKSHILLDPYYL